MEYMLAVSKIEKESAMVSLMRFQRLWKGTDRIDRKFDETELKTVSHSCYLLGKASAASSCRRTSLSWSIACINLGR